MRLPALLLAGLATALLSATGVAGPPNALDAYVARPDPSYGYRVVGTCKGEGYRCTILQMTSQTWGPKDVDDRVWKHWMTVVIPDRLVHTEAILYITGAGQKKGDAPPTAPEGRFIKLAMETGSVVVDLDDVPNQPLTFADDPLRKARMEDEIIAYLQARFIETRNPEDLLRLPMVKSATQAMTTVQDLIRKDSRGRRRIDGFVVAGGSKRGWTTWLVGAVDRRVVAIIPFVINVLSFDETIIHHWRALGHFSPALKDYMEAGLIPGRIGTPALAELNRIEDPLNYQDRKTMRIPKYVINSVGDEYFPPDITRYGYPKVAEPKRLRMIPNARHSTPPTDIMESVTAFCDAVLNRRALPKYSWTVRDDGALVVKAEGRPSEVRLWQATNPQARDFRVDTIGKAFTSTTLSRAADGTFIGAVLRPASGYTAYFVELVYPSGTKYPLKFTTEVQVIPDILPYRWEDARPVSSASGTTSGS